MITRGQRIRALRKERGMTQNDLVKETKRQDPTGEGLSQQTISKLERNATEGTMSLVLLAKVLRTTAEYLETGTEPQTIAEPSAKSYHLTTVDSDLMDDILDAIAEHLESTRDYWPQDKIWTEAQELYDIYKNQKHRPSRSNIIKMIVIQEKAKYANSR